MADGQHFNGHDSNIGKAQDNASAKDAPSPFHDELQKMQSKPDAVKPTDTQQAAGADAGKDQAKDAVQTGDNSVAKASDTPLSKTEQEFNAKSPAEGINDLQKSMTERLSQITQPEVRASIVSGLKEAMAFHAEHNAAQGLGNANLDQHVKF